MKRYEIIGWLGATLVLGSYILLSTGMIHDALPYYVMVGAGSIGVGAISYKKKIWQPFVINTVFFSFSIVAILRILL